MFQKSRRCQHLILSKIGLVVKRQKNFFFSKSKELSVHSPQEQFLKTRLIKILSPGELSLPSDGPRSRPTRRWHVRE